MSEARFLIRLLRMHFPWNWEFGSTLSKLWNVFWGEGVEPPKSPPRYATDPTRYSVTAVVLRTGKRLHCISTSKTVTDGWKIAKACYERSQHVSFNKYYDKIQGQWDVGWWEMHRPVNNVAEKPKKKTTGWPRWNTRKILKRALKKLDLRISNSSVSG
jgi:hypothetical protein